MKQSFALLAVAAGAAMAQTLNSCAQMCVNNMNIIANTEFSCAAGDVACFCTRSNWAYGVRDCSRQACSAEDSAQAVSYAAGLCQVAASAATGTNMPAALPILTSALASTSGEASATGSASRSAITTQPLLATVTNDDGDVETTTTGFSTVYSSGVLTESVASVASSAASSIASELSSALSSIAASASSAAASVTESLSSEVESATGSVASAASSVASAGESAASSAASAVESAASSAVSQGAAPRMTGVPVAAGFAAAAWFLI